MRAVLYIAAFVILSALYALPSLATPLREGDFLVLDRARRAVFHVDPLTGDRSVISGCADSSCSSMIGAGGAFFAPAGLARAATQDLTAPIYVTDTLNDSLLRIDPASGLRTVVSSKFVGSGPEFVSPVAVTVQANGNLLVVDQSLASIIEVDASTGNRVVVAGCPDASCATTIGSGAMFSAPHDLSIDASGDLLLLDSALDAVFRVDAATGDRSLLSSSVAGFGPNFAAVENIVLDASGNIYVTDSNSPSSAPGTVFRIDPLTGERVVMASESVGSGRNLEVPVGLSVDRNGNLIVLDFAPGIILSIDPWTGNRTIVSSSQQGTGLGFLGPSSILVIPQPIPEPSAALLIGIGFGLLGRRRRGNSVPCNLEAETAE